MSDGLRLMIYDNTDVKSTARQIRQALPDPLDPLVPDDLTIELGLSHSWFAGGALYRMLGRIDHHKGFDSWEDALTWLTEIEPDQPIAEVHYWGHGSPGYAWMNGRTLTINSFDDDIFGPLLAKVKTRLTMDALIWFRVCALFTGVQGQAFAKVWSDKMRCRIASHTFNIGLFQSGLHSCGPGEEPRWPGMEGINEGDADTIRSLRWSVPWAPNTITCLGGKVPKNW